MKIVIYLSRAFIGELSFAVFSNANSLTVSLDLSRVVRRGFAASILLCILTLP